MATIRTVLLLLELFTVCYCLKRRSLGGEWIVREATGKYDNLKATVPGGIYTDLMNNKIIGDVFYGNNDTETRWVAQSDWIYTSQFLVDESFLNHKSINLVFEGLDTFATVLINNVEVGSSENMFVRYIFDIKNNLEPGNNTIEVQFSSPIKTAQSLILKQGYTVPPNCPPDNYRGECHVNQIRKMQASFAWDWGPALPSMGIWKEVFLQAYNSSVIRYVMVDPKDAPNDSWLITVSTYLSAEIGETIQGKLSYSLETDVSLIQQIVDVNRTNTDNENELLVDYSFTIPKITVRKWWPNGYGAQKLYNFTAKWQSGSEIDSKTVKIGFRTIELVQEPIGPNPRTFFQRKLAGSGLSFYFRVNGLPMFAKGSNEIPLDILPERGQNPQTVDRILQSAYSAHMNMLRVWGGGVYESDYFYQRADELGILIWQDFMFACAMYPTYPEYLDNVKAEVRHQVRRLNGHPSVALWAANNENELALMTNWYGTSNDFDLYKGDYVKLYIDTVRSELFKYAKDVIFVSSSPSNGKKTVQENYLSSDPGNPLFGDVHYYNYLVNSLDARAYPIPRFASEYGYQSLPDFDTWLTATDNAKDLYPNSSFMDHRQHHPFGLIENNLLMMYQLNFNDTSDNFYKTYMYYTQIIQAMSIKFETEYYRSFMGRVDSSGRGNTMGALFWQLNDVWVAPTWAGIDYTGKWKMLQYFAKEFFAPTIITAYLDIARQLHIYAMTEIASIFGSRLNVSAVIDVYKWTSFSPINSTVLDVSLEYGKALQIAVVDTDNYLNSIGCGSLPTARNQCFFYLSLISGNSVIAPHNLILAAPLKHSNLAKTQVSITSVIQVDDKGVKFEITLTADGISLFVWLDSHRVRGQFSENGFAQVVPTKAVTFQSETITSVATLENVITVNHLNNRQYQ
ncbi:beta-mannosidase [Tribolium castaneum]|uniref:beta-mannosidase n=1 Tax=Tribolium castaneum TaxID=7070 RepID=A0A139WEX1_TRICA|nr:PREDICTED: beta-mannosidase-like [Tribolium castaneum]KYB26528.1 Beta-mannosidase-like Protein [Tribolium castaneum]|eukprot:XP_008196389.1 PREDICTED: beta-mannosidase-like [Tribolium castaneum]